MAKKLLILSSAGLQNIIPNIYNEEDEFCFFFGNNKIKMSKIFADFISPLISNIHRSDPTIAIYECPNNYITQEILDDKTLSFMKSLSLGQKIEIDEHDGKKLQQLAILIENNELYQSINKLFPQNTKQNFNLDEIINFLKLQEKINKIDHGNMIDYSSIIDHISSQFYSIDKNKIKQLPLHILYQIISSKKLKLIDEDSLLKFINEIFKIERTQESRQISIIEFYEEIEFECLSNKALEEFLHEFDPNLITQVIWGKLKQCLLKHSKEKENLISKQSRYTRSIKCIEYNGNTNGAFNGIINYLTRKSEGNVSEKKEVKVTSSSINCNRYDKYAVDLENKETYFQSRNEKNAWLKYDFGDIRIHPTHYTIRTRHDHCGRCWSNPQNWVIEGSNTDNENNWKILDAQTNIKFLDEKSKVHTFSITNEGDEIEYFRYLRMRQIGIDTNGDYQLTLSALEYFGFIYAKED